MYKINAIIDYFRNMNDEKVINILIAIIIITLFCSFSSLISYLIIKLFMRKEKGKQRIKSNAFYLPLKTLLITIGIYIAILILDLPSSVMEVCRKIFKIVIICIVTQGLVNLVDPKLDIVQKFSKKDQSNEEKTIAKFTGKILKYIFYIIAVFLILHELEYDISGLVAGLGIGSAVIALAAQDLVKSLLSGMSIVADKPFSVGDWIAVGTMEGSVVDISFRATKIRTADNSVITIQNSVLTSNSIINWSKLEKRRYSLNLKLPLETNADTIETIVNRLRFVLQANEDIDTETINVHFTAIGTDGINLQIYCYTTITDYVSFLQFKQEVNKQILKVLESENVKLAYPGQNIYLINEEEKLEKENKINN